MVSISGEWFRLFSVYEVKMTAQIGFPLQTVYSITGISNALPGGVTLFETSRQYALSVANQQLFTFHNIRGMTALNNNRFIVNNLDANTNTFEIYDIEGKPVDTSSFM